ncbi:MAG: thymidylate kinase [Firmicutes bacterium]|nr:thymidylate kinase [Bacillota bacterium]
MKKGKLIVIEGACDGIGKSTQFQLLHDKLKSEGNNVFCHHFPSYGTFQGAPVEKYLAGEFGQPNELSPYFITALYANDRAITWHSCLKHKYEDDSTILLDRYTTSSLIYQSALIESLDERKDFIDYVTDFEYNKLGILKPDHVIFLSAPFDLVTELRNQRKNNDGVINDIHERNLDFMKKVYENAMFLSEYLSWDNVKCNIGDTFRTVDDIHDEVYSLVKKLK